MPRYKLTIEYDGSPFFGWQSQGAVPTVQKALAGALLKLTGEKVTVYGAGRTDAGVHATGQVAHIDLARDWSPDTIRDGANAHLRPAPVAVLAAERVDAAFHARFSARRRAYLYRIINRRADLTLDRGRAWRVGRPLDADAMHEAAQVLVGRHDFTTFRHSECQAKSPVRSIDLFTVERTGEEIRCCVEARAFLHHQVRSMVGCLALVGEGRWTRQDLVRALDARDRKACGPMAPAAGLCFVRVDY